MWRQDDLFSVINTGSPAALPTESRQAMADAMGALSALEIVLLPACPLMHGTGAFTAVAALDAGGTVCTLPERKLDVISLLDTVQREKVRILTIVGDAFARPIVEALDAEPHRWDVSSLLGMISSGVMWSEEMKKALLRHNPAMMLVDVFSSSEAVGMGSSVSTATAEAPTAVFNLGENARIIDDDDHPVGAGMVGRLALAGRVPLGYYKDPEKTARTFPVIDGVRYSVPGDYAMVDEEGAVHILGRGSMVINTGGEKVYPEEVEEAIKTHPAVADAAAVGLPDARFGETITAMVELRKPAPTPAPTAEEIGAHVRETLAPYKAPRQVVFVDSLQRSPSGKLDYTALRERAREALGTVSIDA